MRHHPTKETVHWCECRGGLGGSGIGTHRFGRAWECDVCYKIRRDLLHWDYAKARDLSGNIGPNRLAHAQ